MDLLIKTILIFIFCLNVINIQGQSYFPILEEGKKWNIYSPNNSNGGNFIVPQVTCDTIQRNGLTYQYVRCDFGSCFYDCYLREDTSAQRVFQIDPGPNEQETLILDFNLEVGDTFQYLPNYTPVVDDVYLDTIFGNIRKVIAFDSLLSFIEGVGSSVHGPLPAFEGFSIVNSFGEVTCDEIFSTTEEISDPIFSLNIYPNPNHGEFQILVENYPFSNDFPEVRIYSLLGKLLFSELLTANSMAIDLNNLEGQTVIVQLESRQFIQSRKVIILKE